MRQRQASFGRRARAASLWGLALFVGGQLGLGLLLDYRYPLTRFPSAEKVISVAATEPRPPTVAFFGSSRTGAAVDTARANRLLATESGRSPPPRVVNLAVPCGDPIAIEFVLDHALAAGVRPAWAVVEVSPETLNYRTPWVRYHVARQFTWAEVPAFAEMAWETRSVGALWTSRLVPGYVHRHEIVRQAKLVAEARLPAAAGRHAWGGLNWQDVIRPPDRLPDEKLLELSRATAWMTIRRWVTPYRIDGPEAAALERILGRCRGEEIGIVLLGIPACSATRAEFTPAIEAEYRGYLDRLSREYGCRFVDAGDWVPDRLFADADHVRIPDGAAGFTDRLTREVLLKLPLE
ncbi:MAG TPA: hypothetical protein VKD90_01880 [Gemmataceae bacterium]|nr:hypothetical protein [Gemmataceae bacterium]